MVFKQLEWSRVFSLSEKPEESATVLMRLDNGYPLLVQKQVGAGNVLLLTSSIDLEWGNFPLQSVFMPLVQRIVTVLGGSTGGVNLRSTGVVGERGQLPLRDAVGDLILKGPLGSTGLQQQRDHVSFDLLRPGPYRLAINQGPVLAWIAANTNRSESNVRAIEPLLEVAAEVDPERFLKSWMLAPWLIFFALVLALIQALLSRKINPFQGDSDA